MGMQWTTPELALVSLCMADIGNLYSFQLLQAVVCNWEQKVHAVEKVGFSKAVWYFDIHYGEESVNNNELKGMTWYKAQENFLTRKSFFKEKILGNLN